MINGTVTIGQYRERLVEQLQLCCIPRMSWEALTEYILQGRPVGLFIAAVLCNDLVNAVKHADDLNAQRLRDYITFLEGAAPATSWGSDSAFRSWMRRGGLVGIVQRVQVVVPDRSVVETSPGGSPIGP